MRQSQSWHDLPNRSTNAASEEESSTSEHVSLPNLGVGIAEDSDTDKGGSGGTSGSGGTGGTR